MPTLRTYRHARRLGRLLVATGILTGGAVGTSQARGASSSVRSFDSATYSPLQNVYVTVQVSPDISTMAWAAEEKPPTAWVVADISHSGVWDPVNEKVKWGPFFDNQARILTYRATPPTGETGTKAFIGQASFDGASVNTSGSATLSRGATVQYQLTTSVNGGHGTLSPAGALYVAGTVVVLTATPDADYRVKAWSGADDASSTSSTNTVTMTADKAVSVAFEAIPPTQYAISATTTPGNAGSVSRLPEQTGYDAGVQVLLTATANAGYVFDHWEGDLTGSVNPAAITMDGNKTVTAVFVAVAPAQYALTVMISPVGAGTVTRSPDAATYADGSAVGLTATANAGYVFDHWEGDLTGSVNPATITMGGNTTVTAIFVAVAPPQYALTVTVSPAGAGTVARSPNVATYASGFVVALTATPAGGYRVKGWSGSNDDSSTADTNTVTMNSDATVAVEFEQIPPSPPPSPPPASGGSGGQPVLLAAPADGTLAASVDQIEVTWTEGGGSETGYELQRRTGSIGTAADTGTDWIGLAKLAAHIRSYVDQTVEPGTTYRYRVRATMSGVASSWLDLGPVTMPAPPEAPTDVTFTSINHAQVGLRWTDMADDETVFVVHRKVGDGDWEWLTTLPTDTTSYTDSVVSPQVAYTYRVAASNDIGRSDWATSSRIIAPAAPVPAAAPASPEMPAPAPVPESPADVTPTPVPVGFCGAGIVQAMLVSLSGLCLLRSLGVLRGRRADP